MAKKRFKRGFGMGSKDSVVRAARDRATVSECARNLFGKKKHSKAYNSFCGKVLARRKTLKKRGGKWGTRGDRKRWASRAKYG